MKKLIYTTGLLAKFYIKHGWLKFELEECLTSGDVILHPLSEDEPYYYFPIGSTYNTSKLLEKGYVYQGNLFYTVEERLEMTDEEILNDLNWSL